MNENNLNFPEGFNALDNLKISDVTGENCEVLQKLKEQVFTLITKADYYSQNVKKIKMNILKSKETDRVQRVRYERLKELETRLEDEILQNEALREDSPVRDEIFLEKLETVLKLKRFKEALEKLMRVERLKKEIVQRVFEDPETALERYDKLLNDQDSPKVSPNSLVYGEYLSGHVKKTTEDVGRILRKTYEEALRKSLREVDWPKFNYNGGINNFNGGKDLELYKESKIGWRFGLLLRLSSIEVGNRKLKEDDIVKVYKVLLENVESEFQYHFLSEEHARTTARIDKPEWAYEWVLRFLQTNLPFFQQYLQKIHDTSKCKEIDSTHQVLSVMLEMLKKKIDRDKQHILNIPEILPNYVEQTLSFETCLLQYNILMPDLKMSHCQDKRNIYALYNALLNDSIKGSGINIFEVLVDYISNSSDKLLKDMFAGEEPVALKLVYEDPIVNKVDNIKLTQSADMLLSILHYSTNFCKLLPNSTHKLVFIKGVQIKLLKKYLDYILYEFKNVASNSLINDDVILRRTSLCASSINVILSQISQFDISKIALFTYYNYDEHKIDETPIRNEILTLFEDAEKLYNNSLKQSLYGICKYISFVFIQSCENYFKSPLFHMDKSLLKCYPEYKQPINGVSTRLFESLSLLMHLFTSCYECLPGNPYSRLIIDVFKNLDETIFHELLNRKNIHLNDFTAAQFKFDVEQGLLKTFASLISLSPIKIKHNMNVCLKLSGICLLFNLRNDALFSESFRETLQNVLNLDLKNANATRNIYPSLRKLIENSTNSSNLALLESLNIYNISSLDALDAMNLIGD